MLAGYALNIDYNYYLILYNYKSHVLIRFMLLCQRSTCHLTAGTYIWFLWMLAVLDLDLLVRTFDN